MLTITEMIDSVTEVPATVHDVRRINSVEVLYPAERQSSKTPTFLLTYGGTWMGIVGQIGWAKDKAKRVAARYHDLYRVSDEWVKAKLDEASRTGYVTVAFGLRVRTPLLAQVIRGNSKTPHEAEAEGRTAGNALGQSYGLLNNRAASAFMARVRSSPQRLDVRPCAHVHDAQYYLVRDDAELVAWVNRYLIEETFWQDLPDIAHPTVRLGGKLAIFYPSWATPITIPNGATPEEITETVAAHLQKGTNP